MQNAGPETRGSRDAGVRGPGFWKTRDGENTVSGKRGVWKTQGLVENVGSSEKRGVQFFAKIRIFLIT